MFQYTGLEQTDIISRLAKEMHVFIVHMVQPVVKLKLTALLDSTL